LSSESVGEWCPGDVFIIMGKPVEKGAQVSVRVRGYKATIRGRLECYEPVRGYLFIRLDGDSVMIHIKDIVLMIVHSGKSNGVLIKRGGGEEIA